MGRYNYVTLEDRSRLHDVGIDDDGSLWNPQGHDPALIRAAVEAADALRHERRSRAALEAAQTRKRRREQKIWQIAGRILAGANIGNRQTCVICGRGLGDPVSIERGIGSECWQAVLLAVERQRSANRTAAA